jgi:protein-glucosylgalactosylhydroxylysine glucosidase
MREKASQMLILLALVLACAGFARGQVPPDWAPAFNSGDLLFATAREVQNLRAELLPTVGNGFAATRIGSDTLYIGGLFNGHLSTSPSHRARIPSPLNVGVNLPNSDAGKVPKNELRMVGMALDLRHGEAIERFEVVSGGTSSVLATVDVVYFCHRVHRSLCVVEVKVSRASSSSSSSSVAEGNDPIELLVTQPALGPSKDIALQKVPGAPVPSGAVGWAGSTIEAETRESGTIRVAVVTRDVPAAGLPVTIGAGERGASATLLTALHSGVDVVGSGDPLEAAVATYELGLELAAAGSLEASHAAAWAKGVWGDRSVAVGTGNSTSLELARVVNASFYYIMASNRVDYPWGLSPGGLASNGYNGHTFWDQESWMYPPVLMFDPEAAKALLEYRYNHMAGAYQKAHNATFYPPRGYLGTMYPWESAFTGREACPTSASTGRFEQHISGDIAVAIRQLYYASGDSQWAASRALPMMEGIAAFWASRAVPGAGEKAGTWVIDGVTPPDEYAVNVSNSAYTNAVAAISLEFASELAADLGRGTAADAETRKWLEIAAGLRKSIPFDGKLGVTLEFDAYRGEVIKQADVALLSFPLRFIANSTVARRNLEYYAGRTDAGGPAMTWGVYAAGFLALGEAGLAAKYFAKSHAGNSRAPFFVWTETPTGGTTNFITGAGGFLGGIAFGYGGVHYTRDAMLFAPTPPPGARELRLFGVRFRGSVLDIRLGSHRLGEVEVTLMGREGTGAPGIAVETVDGRHRQPLDRVGHTARLPRNTPCRVVLA